MEENVSGCFFSEHSVVRFHVLLNSETILVATLWTGSKHAAFSTNHV